MFAATDTAWAPWFVARSEDKKRVRLNIITHLLSQIPYEALPVEHVTLPKGFVNGMVASHLLCHSGTINRHSLNGALLS
jgi:hypothetical protein